MKTNILVCGAGGFIGNHLVTKLKTRNAFVLGVDLKHPEFSKSRANKFLIGDLRDQVFCSKVFKENFDEVYQLAADMGGAGYIFSGENDAKVMHNSAQINLNIAELVAKNKMCKLFFSSSACIYPKINQENEMRPDCSEQSAYPADPDSEYGWEKLFSERMYLAFHRNQGLNIRIARFHNIFGPEGPWEGGREKAPAAICRKVALAEDGKNIEIWGDGKQTRSFLYIDECLDGVGKLMQSDFIGPVNIGSEEMVSINDMAKMVIKISGKKLRIKNVPGIQGVRGRNSDNKLLREKLGWSPSKKLYDGLKDTYKWIEKQVEATTK